MLLLLIIQSCSLPSLDSSGDQFANYFPDLQKDMLPVLNAGVNSLEIKQAVFAIGGPKDLGVDGMPPRCYQQHFCTCLRR